MFIQILSQVNKIILSYNEIFFITNFGNFLSFHCHYQCYQFI